MGMIKKTLQTDTFKMISFDIDDLTDYSCA